MNKELIYYTLFDVFYLIQLFKSFKINKIELNMINYFLYPTLLEKNKIENDIEIINNFNNNFILDYNNEQYTMNYLVDYYYNFFKTNDFDFNIISDIPYLKKIFNYMIKKIILLSLVKYIMIYETKNNVVNNKIKKNMMKFQLILPENKFINILIKKIDNDIKKLIGL